MKRLAILVMGLTLTGCSTVQIAACPAGQASLRTAQLFFARNDGKGVAVSDTAFRKFVTDEVSPRFPQGLSVLDGGAQWRGEANKMIRDSAKVVSVALPTGRDASEPLEAVRGAYRTRFKLDSQLQVTEPSCVAL